MVAINCTVLQLIVKFRLKQLKISGKGYCQTLVVRKWSLRGLKRLIFSKHKSHFNVKNYTMKTAEL